METIIWLVLIVIFVGVEIATVGLTSVWFAGGAVAGLFAQLLGMPVFGQVIIFIAVSAVLLIFTRPWALRYLKPRLVKTNYETVIGEEVCVTETIDNIRGSGTAVYKGQEWTARAFEAEKCFEKGALVMVKEIRGVTLYVGEKT